MEEQSIERCSVNRALCCGFGTAGSGLWVLCEHGNATVEKGGCGRGGGVDNVERVPGLPRWGLFLLYGATDEPQMDGQLLWVSEPREVGVTKEKAVHMF